MYTVKFIDNEEFDSLPYNRVASSIGVADRNSGIAYVRDTGNPMDIFTAYHELEHLKGDDLSEYESPGEDGVYYKDLGQILAPIGMALGGAFTGGALPAMAAGGGIGSQVGGFFGSGKGKEQPQQQQQPMNQFNPSSAMQPQEAQSPAVSQVGGGNGGNFGGGNMGGSAGTPGGGMIGKVQDYLRNQAGFYSGRTPQGGM